MDIFKYFFTQDVDESSLTQVLNPEAQIIFLSTDLNGNIIYANNQAKDFLVKLTPQKHIPKNLVGKSLAKIVDRPFLHTEIGLTLKSKKEIIAKLLSIGEVNYVSTTKLIKNEETGEIIGCMACYIEANLKPEITSNQALQSIVKDILRKRGYSSINWVNQIDSQHALQLIRCLLTVKHEVKIPDYCPYKQVCLFNPIHGSYSLDRRRYYRVPVKLPIILYIEAVSTDLSVNTDIGDKYIDAESVDLSAGGIKILCPLRFPINSILRIQIQIEPPIICSGQVVWVSQTNNGCWVHGLKFVNLNENTSSSIIKIINNLQLEKPL